MNRLKQLVEEEHLDLSNAIEQYQTSNVYPTKPTKPSLAKNHNIEELKLYNEQFEQYVKDIDNYNVLYLKYTDQKSKIEAEIKEYLWEITGLNEISPQYRDKIWNKADSLGYYEVYLKLLSLVEIFE